MKKIKVSKSMRVGWEKFMERPWYLLGISLAVLVLSTVTASQGAFYTALSSIIMGGFFMLLLSHHDGKKVVLDDLFSINDRWISFTFVIVIKSIAILIGLFLFIVPGVYLLLRWMFAEFLVLDKNMKPMEAFRVSSEMTKGHMWKLFWFTIVSLLILALGLVLLVVGFFPALLIVTFAIIDIYRRLS